MIGITINDEALQLDEGTSVALEFNNPMFDDTVMQGDYSLPVSIPYPANASLLKFMHQLLLRTRTKSYANARLLFKNTPINNGIIDVDSVDNGYASASLRLNISGLTAIDKKLSELNLGGMRDLGDNTTDVITNASAIVNGNGYPDNEFNFPMINNPSFYGDKNTDFEGWVNNYAGGALVENVSTNRNCLVPMVYLFYVLKQGFAEDGYTIEEDEFYELLAPPSQLVIYNNRAIDSIYSAPAGDGMHATTTTDTGFSGGTPETILFDNDSTGVNYDPLAAYNPATGEYEIQAAGNHVISAWLLLHCPVVGSNSSIQTNVTVGLYLDGVLIHQENKTYTNNNPDYMGFIGFNYAMTVGDVGKMLTVRIVGSDPYEPGAITEVIATSYFSVNDLGVTTTLNRYNGKFDLRNHVPDITFGELLNVLKKTFNLTFTLLKLGSKVIKIQPARNFLVANPTKDWSDKSLVGHKISFTQEGVYKSLAFTFSGDDANETDNFKAIDPTTFIGNYKSLAELTANAPAAAAYAGCFAMVQNVNQYFKCVDTGGAVYAWQYFTDAYAPTVIDANGTVEHETGMSSMFMKYFDIDTTPYIALHINQAGSSAEFNLGDNKFDLRMFYCMGEAYNEYPGKAIPFNTTTGRDINGTFNAMLSIPNNYYIPLNFDISATAKVGGLVSLYKHWEDLIAIRAKNELYTKTLQLNLVDLLTYNIYETLRIDRGCFVIKSLKLEIGDRIGEATLELYKV